MLEKRICRNRTWERISNYNAALDFGFRFGHHNLSGTVEAFHKQNNNMLVSITLPAILGDKAPSANAGKFRDYGVDGQLTYSAKFGDWSYSLGGILTWARNELVAYEGTSVRKSGYTNTQVGYGMNSLFGLRYGGKIQNEEQLEAHRRTQYLSGHNRLGKRGHTSGTGSRRCRRRHPRRGLTRPSTCRPVGPIVRPGNSRINH